VQVTLLVVLTFFQFRSFRTDSKVDDFRGFLDGDLLESFLDFTSTKQHEIVNTLNDEMRDDEAADWTPLSVHALRNEISQLRQMH